MKRLPLTARGSDTHRGAMRVHALRRLFMRHGIALTNAEFNDLVAAIALGKHPALGHARTGGTIHMVEIRGRTIYAVWATDVQYIATFLPSVPLEVRYPAIARAISA